jgi:poly-gamma-glutamate system protein
MKKVYRRPYRMSRAALVAITAAALAGLMVVETAPSARWTRRHDEMVAASKLASQCFEAIRTERLARGIEINRRFDPADSGLIGAWMTPTTSVYGNLHSKQTSINPNFAAAIVSMLKEAGVEEGDAVAVGFSGSFPALNACVLAACETVGARPIAISAATASQWGANVPDYLWLNMENVLLDKGLIRHGSVAASIGGRKDRASGMSAEGVKLLEEALERSGVRVIAEPTYEESVDRRMAIYRESAGGARIAAYVNVGGATVSVGTPIDKRTFHPGVTDVPPEEETALDSVMRKFIDSGVPVIHLSEMHVLAREWGLPWRPTTTPEVGEGGVYLRGRYSRPLALGVLAVLCALIAAAALAGRRAARKRAASSPV